MTLETLCLKLSSFYYCYLFRVPSDHYSLLIIAGSINEVDITYVAGKIIISIILFNIRNSFAV